MDEQLKNYQLRKLMEARASLTSFDSKDITGENLEWWWGKYESTFEAVDNLIGKHIWLYINKSISDYFKIGDSSVANAARESALIYIDENISLLNGIKDPRSVFDRNILLVKNSKLSVLLNEFNRSLETNPNLAAIGFRTILALIIKERAKLIQPNSNFSKSEDTGNFKGNIEYAIDNKLFNDGHTRHLKTYLNGVMKDSFDNVAHKDHILIETDYLGDAIKLLNILIPTLG